MSNEAPLQIKPWLASTRIKMMGAAVILIAMSPIPVAAATGSPACASRPEFLKQLSHRFHEEPGALGVTNNVSLIEVLTSDDGSTWTMMVKLPRRGRQRLATTEACR